MNHWVWPWMTSTGKFKAISYYIISTCIWERSRAMIESNWRFFVFREAVTGGKGGGGGGGGALTCIFIFVESQMPELFSYWCGDPLPDPLHITEKQDLDHFLILGVGWGWWSRTRHLLYTGEKKSAMFVFPGIRNWNIFILWQIRNCTWFIFFAEVPAHYIS